MPVFTICLWGHEVDALLTVLQLLVDQFSVLLVMVTLVGVVVKEKLVIKKVILQSGDVEGCRGNCCGVDF